MSEYFEFFSNDFNNWNYNERLTKPDIDPFNNNKKLDPFGYNLYKYNTIIMLKEILKNTKQYIEEERERARARERDTHAHTHTQQSYLGAAEAELKERLFVPHSHAHARRVGGDERGVVDDAKQCGL